MSGFSLALPGVEILGGDGLLREASLIGSLMIKFLSVEVISRYLSLDSRFALGKLELFL